MISPKPGFCLDMDISFLKQDRTE